MYNKILLHCCFLVSIDFEESAGGAKGTQIADQSDIWSRALEFLKPHPGD